MVTDVYSFILTLIFIMLTIILLRVTLKSWIAGNRYGARSTFICVIIFTFFTIYNIFFGFFKYPFNGFMVWWFFILLFVNIPFMLIIKREINKIKAFNEDNSDEKEEDKSKLRKYVKVLIMGNPYSDDIPVKRELLRKAFHSLGVLIVIAYYGFFFIPPITEIINNILIDFIQDTRLLYNLFWGDITNYPYIKNDFKAVKDITLFILVGALFLTTIIDSIRTLLGPQYSILNLVTREVLRSKELNASGPQIHLLTGTTLSYLFYIIGIVSAEAVFSALLISCISDAIAALVGRNFGNHKVKCIGGDLKSREGFTAGFGSAFLLGLIFLGPIYALVAAIIFLIVDYIPLFIADNISNPIIITLGLALFYYISGIPMGWI